MLRAVLAVALAAAILAATFPALDSARTTRAETLTATELDRVEATGESLVREEDAVALDAAGARRTLSVSVPDASPTSAAVAYVSLGGVPGDEPLADSVADGNASDLLAYRLAGGDRRVRQVGFDLRVVRNGRVLGDDRQLVLRGDDRRLTFRLVRLDGRPTVLVGVGSRPTVRTAGLRTANRDDARNFKSENGTNPDHEPAVASPRPNRSP